MQVIGEAIGIKLHSPKDAYFSYFNSPYSGHSHAAAIDIYPSHQEWGGSVVSPVTGKLVRIQKTAMGRKKIFPTEDHDFGIAIEPEDCEGAIVRILHCKPTLIEGDTVNRGDKIGITIRSRYFNYWTGPHYHVEIMHLDSFPRSTRSYPLALPFEFQDTASKEIYTETEFRIESVTDENIVGYPKDFSHTSIGQFSGLSAINDESNIIGIIDGGFSHYKHGGVIGQTSGLEGSTIKLQSIPVGVTKRSLKGASFFQRDPSISSYLNDSELRGLSCFIFTKKYIKNGIPPLVLVPKTYKEFTGVISEGDICTLKVDSASNTIKAE